MEVVSRVRASVAGAGKFENGAITGAFEYLFNQMAGIDPKASYVAAQGQSVMDVISGISSR